MRYWSYNEYSDADDPAGSNYVVVKSEDEIMSEYYPYWKGRMIEKFGEEIFEKNWSPKDCLDDWIVINWAWESTVDGTEIINPEENIDGESSDSN